MVKIVSIYNGGPCLEQQKGYQPTKIGGKIDMRLEPFFGHKVLKVLNSFFLLQLFPGLDILVHKIHLENFHVVLKSGKC